MAIDQYHSISLKNIYIFLVAEISGEPIVDEASREARVAQYCVRKVNKYTEVRSKL